MQIISRGFRRRKLVVLPLLLMLGACDRGLLDTSAPPPDDGGQRVLGVVEVTLRGIGSSQMTATARLVRAASGPSLALVPVQNGDGSGDGTLRLENEFVGSFTHGTRGAGGQLYMHAGFRVLNMTEGGTPYDMPRRNLTFLGAATTATLDTTPVRELERFDGSDAHPEIAKQVRPTGMVNRSADGTLYVDGVDVLQVYMEHEVRTVTPPAGVTSVFPYGFVARGPGGGREIPVGGEGFVTFAFRVPLQPTATQDPYTVTFSFLAVEDTETRLTQSLEEQTPAGTAAFRARAVQLNASPLILLPGSTFTDSILKWRYVCAVRTAGSAASPDEFLFSPPQPTVRSSAVSGLDDSHSGVPDLAVWNGQGDGTFTNQRTMRRSTRPKDVHVADMNADGFPDLVLPSGDVSNVVVADVPSFDAYRAYGPGPSPVASVVFDMDSDGRLDVVTANNFSKTVNVLRGMGGGVLRRTSTFTVPTPLGTTAPTAPTAAVAAGDVTRDGNPDVVVGLGAQTFLLVGNGRGGFSESRLLRTATPGSNMTEVLLGDFNGDGRLDLAALDRARNNGYVMLNNGSGLTYHAPFTVNATTYALAMGDVNGDARLDAP